MKIAILVLSFPPKWLAGSEIAAYNSAKHLAKRGHETHVITSLDEGLPKTSMEQGFHIHRIRFPRIRLLGILIFWLKALLLLKKVNPDIVHAQGIQIGISGFLAKKFLRKSYIVWAQGSDVYLQWRFKSTVSKLVFRNADAVIALTNDMEKAMQKIYDASISIVPFGINLESFGNLPTKQAIREKLGLNTSDSVILFVGTLRPVKGVKYLIEAMNSIRQRDTKASLVLVGDGEERQSLEVLTKELSLEESVTFIGRVPNEKIPEYMAASDVLVLPSLSESFGIVNLEAMASGLPVVASKVGGLPEIIEDGENGFLVEPKNPEQIAERVLLLLEDDTLRGKISRSNKERAKQYSWESVVGRLEQIYSHVLNKP